MTSVGRYEEHPALGPTHYKFPVSKTAFLQGRIDDDPVIRLVKLTEVTVPHAEAPAISVIEVPVRNPVGMCRIREHVREQFFTRGASVDLRAISDDVQS